MQQTHISDNENHLNDAVMQVLASDQPGVVTGYVTAEEKLEMAAVLFEAGAPETLIVRALAVLDKAVPAPQRDSALWASGWAAADELLQAEKHRDDARITAAYVTALLICDDRRRQTRVHTAVINWNEAAADPASMWRLVAVLKDNAARFELPESEKAAQALEKALRRELPGWWRVSLDEMSQCLEDVPDIFRSYDMAFFEKAPRAWWVKTRSVNEERVLTAMAAHWAGGITVERISRWPAEGMPSQAIPMTSSRWVRRLRLRESPEADPCRRWFERTVPEVAFEIGDPLYEEVVRALKETGRMSTCFLQRTFGIGYRRATMLMARLAKERVI